jgi:hypothetical protein
LVVVALLIAHVGTIAHIMGDPALLQAFKRLLRTPVTEQDLEAIDQEVRGASARAAALIYAAVLDSIIEDCLKSQFPRALPTRNAGRS